MRALYGTRVVHASAVVAATDITAYSNVDISFATAVSIVGLETLACTWSTVQLWKTCSLILRSLKAILLQLCFDNNQCVSHIPQAIFYAMSTRICIEGKKIK